MENLHTSILTIKALKIVIPIAIVLAVFLIKLYASILTIFVLIVILLAVCYVCCILINRTLAKQIEKKINPLTKQLRSAVSDEEKAELYFQRSDTYYSFNMYPQALEDLSSAIALCPRNDRYYCARAKIYYDCGDDWWLDDINTAISLSPESGTYYGLRAYFSACNPQTFDKALQDYGKAIELFKNNPEDSGADMAASYYGRASIYFYLKLYDDALQDVTKAIEIKQNTGSDTDTENIIFYVLRARTCYAAGDYGASIEDYTFLVNNDNTFKDKWLLERAEAYTKYGDETKARSDFKQAVNLHNNDEIQAQVYFQTGEYKKALKILNSAENTIKEYIKKYRQNVSNDFDSHFVEIYFLRGEVYQELKEHDKALEDYKRSIEYYEKIFARNKSELDIYDQIRYNNCLNRITEITGRKHKLNN